MNPAPNLILVGPMGAGKTCIGRRLAERFGLAFIDADQAIVDDVGSSIPTIFENVGEPGFRAHEKRVLAELLTKRGQLISTGGGSVLDADNRQRLGERGFVVYLRVSVQSQLQRLHRDKTRPLLLREDREQVLHAMAELRDPLYREVADLTIDTDLYSPADATAQLVVRLAAQWQISESPRMTASPRTVAVGGELPYQIHIGPGLLAEADLLTRAIRGRHVLLASDDTVAPLYLARVQEALQAARPELKIGQYIIPAGEASKTLDNFGGAINALAALGATRDACVLALGGGVVGDLAGFAAACWMRGVDCVQLPTTLLAMVDSSVGGKTAVDIAQGKNLVGAFHPPRAVIADTSALRTLPVRELRAGLAEVIKYGAIRDPLFFQWLQAERATLLAGDDVALAQAIARSCEHKAEIVERDPLEKGERALLNLGHTFGHAIETAQGYGAPGNDNLNHGEAVAVGMVLAARLSAALGMAPAADTETLRDLLLAYGLPVAIPAGLAPEALLAHMRLDKKNIAGRLRLVLWRGIGKAEVVPDVDEAAVLDVLRLG